MNMKRIVYLVTVVAIMALSVPAISHAIGLEASIGGWAQDPEGYVSYKALTYADRLDIDQNLKYDKETKVFGRLKIDMPLMLPNIYLMATPSRFDGIGQKDISFNFGGKTFQKDVSFNSEVQLDHYDIALYYGIPGLKTLTLGILNVELGLNARIIDFFAKVEQLTISASKRATIPVPMVYGGIQVSPVDLLSVEGEFRGIAYSSNRYYDIIGRLRVKPFGPLFIAGGYRYEDIKIDYSDIESRVKLKGPFLEAGIEF